MSRSASWGLYEADAQNQAEDIARDRVAEESRRRRQIAEAEARDRLSMIPVSLAEAIEFHKKYVKHKPPSNGFAEQREVPGPNRMRLERIGEQISPNELRTLTRDWKTCRNCLDHGIVGDALDRTLTFCECTASDELRYQAGEDWPQREIERVHASIPNKLVAAAKRQGSHLAEALEKSTIEDNGEVLTITPPNGYRLYFDGWRDVQSVEKLISELGLTRRLAFPWRPAPVLTAEVPKSPKRIFEHVPF